jgi:biopolymer transport protein ExbD
MGKRTAKAPSEVALPVTPMLDLAFQLLFYFVATFQPSSAQEGEMNLILPARSVPRAHVPERQSPETGPEKEVIDDRAVVTISLRGYKDPLNRGLISYLTIRTDNINDEEVKGTEQEREQQLAERLGKVKRPQEEKGTALTVRVAAESVVRWSEVMRVMDVCYRAGCRVRFVSPVEVRGG